jgi:Uma2 family endonuclease
MATATTPTTGNAVVLHDIDWRTYTRLLWVFAERPRVRLTYDRGVLEIMSPLKEHENASELLGCFVVVLTEELGLTRQAGGSTTLRRRRQQKGLEPDRCWWIANEPRVRGKRRLNLRVHPPPDLAIETDVTHSSLDRMGIYAPLRVPEVWRLEGQHLSFHLLGPDGKYTPTLRSRSFPLVTAGDLMRFLSLVASEDDTSIVRQFRDWVRQQIAARSAPPSP